MGIFYVVACSVRALKMDALVRSSDQPCSVTHNIATGQSLSCRTHKWEIHACCTVASRTWPFKRCLCTLWRISPSWSFIPRKLIFMIQDIWDITLYWLFLDQLTLEIRGICFSNAWVTVYQSTLHNIPEDMNLQNSTARNSNPETNFLCLM